MKLTNRLQAIADLIEKNSVVADIGSDHGYLVANLVENEIVKSAVASDINEGPVSNCNMTVNGRGLSDSIEVRLGGGFVPYKKNEVDTAIIAGMGGQLIRDIIIESRDIANSIDTIIVQPMTGQEVLREWLINNNFVIEKEVITQEQDRFYEILVLKHGKQSEFLSKELAEMISFDSDDDIFLEIGYKVDLEKSTYEGFLVKKMKKYEMIINQITKNKKSNDASREKMDLATAKLKKLEEVISCIQTLKK